MTIAQMGAESLISRFGEEITIIPQKSPEPKDENNPIYFGGSEQDGDEYTSKFRVFTNPQSDMLEEYGWENDAEAIIYNTEGEVEIGDRVRIFEREFIVDEYSTNQLGEGPYIWVYKLVGV